MERWLRYFTRINTKDLERRLKTAEMWYIGRMLRISWT